MKAQGIAPPWLMKARVALEELIDGQFLQLCMRPRWRVVLDMLVLR